MIRATKAVLLAMLLSLATPAAARDLPPLPDRDISQVKLDPASARRLEALRSEIRRRQRVAAASELASLYGELGMMYQAYLLDSAALVCYENARMLNGDDFRWIYLAGILHQNQRRLDEAESAFRATLERKPGYAPALRRLGSIALEQNRLDEAEALFSQVLTRLGHSPYSLEGLGRIALRRQNYARAAEYFRRALEQDPDANRIHYSLAMALRGLGQPEQARAHLKQRGERRPGAHDPLMVEVAAYGSSAYTHFQRGMLAARDEDFATAVEAFRTAVNQDPDNPDAQMALFDALRRQGRSREAWTRLEVILERFPDNSVAHYWKGHRLREGGEVSDAIPHYRRAVELDPDYVRARYFLANSLMRAGRYDQAAEHYARLRTDLPGEIRVMYQLGLAYLAAGRCAEALEPLRRAYRANTRQYLVIVALARAASTCAEATRADRELALEIAGALYGARPNAETAETLAMALAAGGEFPRAIGLQQQVLAQTPDPFRRENLARFQARQAAQAPWPEDARIYRVPPPVAKDD